MVGLPLSLPTKLLILIFYATADVAIADVGSAMGFAIFDGQPKDDLTCQLTNFRLHKLVPTKCFQNIRTLDFTGRSGRYVIAHNRTVIDGSYAAVFSRKAFSKMRAFRTVKVGNALRIVGEVNAKLFNSDMLIHLDQIEPYEGLLVTGIVSGRTVFAQPQLVSSREALFRVSTDRATWYSAYLAVVIFVLMAGSCLILVARQKVLMSYLLLVTSFHGLATVTIGGFFSTWLNGLSPATYYFIFALILLNASLAIIYFSAGVLNLPNIRRATPMLWLPALSLFAILPPAFRLRATIFVGSFAIIGCLIVAAFKALRGRTAAVFFLIGWVPLCITTLLPSLHYMGYLDLGNNPLFVLNMGMLWEMGVTVFFTTVETLRSHQRGVQSQDELNRSYAELAKFVGEHTHIIERIKHGAQLEETMPIGESQGAILSWDIIGSSQLDMPNREEVFEAVFGAVNELCMQGYSAHNPVAKGYVINEMGDGGLIAVGYPYPLPFGESPCSSALDLANDIQKTVADVFYQFGIDQPVNVCIGIAKGKLRGKYSRHSGQRYEIYGRALTTATRYEGLRKAKSLRNLVRNQSVVILQDDVFYAANKSLTRDFWFWTAVGQGGQIRDDAGKEGAYIRLGLGNEKPTMLAC